MEVLYNGVNRHKFISSLAAGQHHYPIVIGGGPQEGDRTLIRVKANETALALERIGDAGHVVGNIKI